MDAIPADQLERIRPLVESVAASIRKLIESLPDDAPLAPDYLPIEKPNVR
jgi:hypothetical protein